MKLLSFLAVAFVFLGASPIPTTELYTIESSSTQSLGAVTLVSPSSQVAVNIMGSGTYTATLDSHATSIVIAGQQIFYPDGGIVVLPNGNKVKVVWSTSTDLVGVLDIDSND